MTAIQLLSSATPANGTSTSPGRTSTTSGVTSTKANDQLTKDTFLKLLVAQLRYQNPLSPQDGTAFIAQTAQLNMTERLDELATVAKTTLAASNIRAASELVGRTITYNNGSAIVEGTVAAARLNGGAPVLLIGKIEVPLDAVLEVRAAATPAPAAAASTAPPAAVPTTSSALEETGGKSAA